MSEAILEEAEPGRQYDSPVHVDDAILQSAQYIVMHMPELRSLTPEEIPGPPPAFACLPWKAMLP
ncbi:hypothetical protein ACFOEY_05860 [Paracandidimonas soli]|uniref:hypothetical protein n=1 Tax=Paracandidimonas soli TaxID=1917182 RepID=UPI00360776DB